MPIGPFLTPLPEAAPLLGNGKQYEIISAARPEELSRLVSQKLEAGYKLHGSPMYGDSPGQGTRFHQAVVY